MHVKDDPRSARAERIFLIGLMGSGKTTVGTQLAAMLGCRYLDNDTLLLLSGGASAQTMAVAHGADALHQSESVQLRALVDLPAPFVASIAASVGDRPEDMSLLASSGLVVYLRARPTTLANRLGSGEGRPWLGDDPTAVIYRMFAQRDAAYRGGATTVIDCDDVDPYSISQRIALELRSHTA